MLRSDVSKGHILSSTEPVFMYLFAEMHLLTNLGSALH